MSETRYRSVGSKMSKMQAVSHMRQRGTHSNPTAYRSAASQKASLKAQWLSSMAPSSACGGGDSDSD